MHQHLPETFYNASAKAGPAICKLPALDYWHPGADSWAWYEARHLHDSPQAYWAGPWPNTERVQSHLYGDISWPQWLAIVRCMARSKHEPNAIKMIQMLRPYYWLPVDGARYV